MARITRDGFEACVAFGAAALAVAEVGALVADRPMDRATCDLFDELEAAHHRLRALFDLGEDTSVHGPERPGVGRTHDQGESGAQGPDRFVTR